MRPANIITLLWRFLWNLVNSTSWNPQALSRHCFTCTSWYKEYLDTVCGLQPWSQHECTVPHIKSTKWKWHIADTAEGCCLAHRNADDDDDVALRVFVFCVSLYEVWLHTVIPRTAPTLTHRADFYCQLNTENSEAPCGYAQSHYVRQLSCGKTLYRIWQKYLTILQNSCEWNRWRGEFVLEGSSSETQSISIAMQSIGLLLWRRISKTTILSWLRGYFVGNSILIGTSVPSCNTSSS